MGSAGDTKSLRQSLCTPRADAGDLLPAFGSGINDLGDAAVPSQDRSRTVRRDSANRREHRLRRRLLTRGWSLRVRRTIAAPRRCLTTHREPVEPCCSVVTVSGQEQPYSLADRGEADPSNGLTADLSVVNRSPLDDEVRHRRTSAQRSELTPQPPLNQRVVEVTNVLPLDDDPVTHDIVGGWQAVDLHRCAETLERLGNATLPLVYVDDDDRALSHSVECAGNCASATVGRFGAAETAVGDR